MVNLMKRISVIIVTVIICTLSVFQISAVHNVADNGFTYAVYDDYAVIDDYYGEESDIIIPAKLWSIDVTEVGDYAFIENDVIKSVSFKNADKLTTLGFNAFYGCKNLESIEFSENISKIGTGCFQSCVSLKEADIVGDVTRIPDQVFLGCTSLESVELPESVTEIGKYAFADCTSLTYVYVPKTVTSISSNAFSGSPDVVINCCFNSYAYEYAVANHIAYNIIDGFALGDVNHNSILEICDATEIQRFLAEYNKFDDYNQKLSDFDGDGIISIRDVTAIQEAIAEI